MKSNILALILNIVIYGSIVLGSIYNIPGLVNIFWIFSLLTNIVFSIIFSFVIFALLNSNKKVEKPKYSEYWRFTKAYTMLFPLCVFAYFAYWFAFFVAMLMTTIYLVFYCIYEYRVSQTTGEVI